MDFRSYVRPMMKQMMVDYPPSTDIVITAEQWIEFEVKLGRCASKECSEIERQRLLKDRNKCRLAAMTYCDESNYWRLTVPRPDRSVSYEQFTPEEVIHHYVERSFSAFMKHNPNFSKNRYQLAAIQSTIKLPHDSSVIPLLKKYIQEQLDAVTKNLEDEKMELEKHIATLKISSSLKNHDYIERKHGGNLLKIKDSEK